MNHKEVYAKLLTQYRLSIYLWNIWSSFWTDTVTEETCGVSDMWEHRALMCNESRKANFPYKEDCLYTCTHCVAPHYTNH